MFYIPLFLELLIENIENNAATEGLFRKCGLQQAINDMCDKLDANDFQNEDEMRETLLKLSPHDATGILKAYLGTLTIPIVPQAFHPWLMQAEANADVFRGMVKIHFLVSAAYHIEVERAVPRKLFQHMVEEMTSRRHVVLSFAVDNESKIDVRFGCFSHNLRFSHIPFSLIICLIASVNASFCSLEPTVILT